MSDRWFGTTCTQDDTVFDIDKLKGLIDSFEKAYPKAENVRVQTTEMASETIYVEKKWKRKGRLSKVRTRAIIKPRSYLMRDPFSGECMLIVHPSQNPHKLTTMLLPESELLPKLPKKDLLFKPIWSNI